MDFLALQTVNQMGLVLVGLSGIASALSLILIFLDEQYPDVGGILLILINLIYGMFCFLW